MTLPKRRKQKASGIARAPQREWPRHRRWIRGFECAAAGKADHVCEGRIECCHYRTAANSGTSVKPADWETFPACSAAHAEQHRIGQRAFEKKYGLDLASLCAEFAKRSTDIAMREALREAKGA